MCKRMIILVLLIVVSMVSTSLPAVAGDPEPARERWAEYYFAGQKEYEKKDYEKAASSFKSALDEAERGKYEGLIGMTLYNLARTYQTQKDYKQAEPLYKRALAIYENADRRNSFYGIYVMKGYAQLLRDTGRGGEADRLESKIKSPTAGGS